MQRHSRALLWVLGVALCMVTATAAWADVVAKGTGNHRQVNMTLHTSPTSILPICPAGPPCRTPLGTSLYQDDQFSPFANPWTVFHADQDASFEHRAYGGAVYDGPGNKVQISAIAIGEGSTAGGLHGSMYLPPDTAFAGVGLYGPGPTDSMLIAVVDRTSSSTNLGISFPTTSALQVRSLGNSHEQPVSTFKMLVYENEADADADVQHTGLAAKFNGTVVLNGTDGTLKTVQSRSAPGFVSGDWVLINNGGGKYTARAKSGLVKNVPVLNSANAAVVLVADPAIVEATPGVSPAILVLIALALAASGMWAMRRRSGPALA